MALVAHDELGAAAQVAVANRAAEVLVAPGIAVADEPAIELVGRRIRQSEAEQGVEFFQVLPGQSKLQLEGSELEWIDQAATCAGAGVTRAGLQVDAVGIVAIGQFQRRLCPA